MEIPSGHEGVDERVETLRDLLGQISVILSGLAEGMDPNLLDEDGMESLVTVQEAARQHQEE